MNVIERDGKAVRAEYVNSFRVYSGNNEVVLELGQVDLVETLRQKTNEKGEPESMVLDVKGRYILRPEQIGQLINSLVGVISQPQQTTQPEKPAGGN